MELERATPDHEAQILALARRTLGWDEDPRFTDLYRWKHDLNPAGASPRWVALDGDRVVGFRVLMRWRFRSPNGEAVEGVRAVDTATDPDFQGQGIFRSLTLSAIDEVADEGIEFVFNTPNDQSRPGYLKMGWTEVGKPPIAIVAKPRSLVRIARSRRPADLWSLASTSGAAAAAWLEVDGNAEDLAIRLDADRSGHWRTERSAESLRWRYGLQPLHYRVLTSDMLGRPADGRPAVAVFRVRRRGGAIEATVAEVAAEDSRSRRRLLRAVLRSTGADYLLVASSARVDATPAITLPDLGPLVTWRRLGSRPAPGLEEVRLTMGDLELF